METHCLDRGYGLISVSFPKWVIHQSNKREKNPSLNVIQPPNIDRSKITGGELKIDPFVNEFNEKQAMRRALRLNRKVYPRGTPKERDGDLLFY